MGRRQHFQPAVYLAGFSERIEARARDSLLWVGRYGGQTFRQRATNVAWARDLYTLRQPGRDHDPYLVDAHLSAPERRLRQAIDIFAVPGLPLFPAAEWLTLVSFIAGLFVRGPEFATRFESRPVIRAVRPGDRDNTQFARIMEHQRLLAAVMYADWVVIRSTSRRPIIASDIGYTLTLDGGGGRWGYVVPLNRRTALALFPSRAGNLVFWHSGAWTISLPETEISSDAVRELNRRIAQTAAAEVYGATNTAVDEVASAIGGPNTGGPRGPDLLVPSTNALRDHDFDYIRAFSMLHAEPSPAVCIRLGWPPATDWSRLASALANLA